MQKNVIENAYLQSLFTCWKLNCCNTYTLKTFKKEKKKEYNHNLVLHTKHSWKMHVKNIDCIDKQTYYNKKRKNRQKYKKPYETFWCNFTFLGAAHLSYGTQSMQTSMSMSDTYTPKLKLYLKGIKWF